MGELIQTRRIVSELAKIIDRLSRSDRRFVESWTAYLARTGDGAGMASNYERRAAQTQFLRLQTRFLRLQVPAITDRKYGKEEGR